MLAEGAEQPELLELEQLEQLDVWVLPLHPSGPADWVRPSPWPRCALPFCGNLVLRPGAEWAGSIGPLSMTSCFSMLDHSMALAALQVVVAEPLRLVSHLGALVARAVLLDALLATILVVAFSAGTVEILWAADAREGRLLPGASVLLSYLRRWLDLVVLVQTRGPAAVVSVRLLVWLLVHLVWLVLVPELPGL